MAKSLWQTFTDAFKKASEKNAIDTKELARNSGGSLGPAPASSEGSFAPLKAAAPAPETQDSGLKVDALKLADEGNAAVPNIEGVKGPRDAGPIVKPPSEPSPPNEPGDQGPIDGGGGGGTPTPPSAPFDPNEVIFKTAGGSGRPNPGDFQFTHVYDKASPVLAPSTPPPPPPPPPPPTITHEVNSGGVNPLVTGRDRALGDGIAEDPDAGGENKAEGDGPLSAARTPGKVEYPNLKVEDELTGGIKAGDTHLKQDVFFKGDIKGESLDPKHKEELEILASRSKIEVDYKVDYKLEGLKAELEYKPEGDYKPEGPIKFEGVKGESLDPVHKAELELKESTGSGADSGQPPGDAGRTSGSASGKPEDPGQTSGSASGKPPEDPGHTSGSGAGKPPEAGHTGGSGAGRPGDGPSVASSDPEEGGEATPADLLKARAGGDDFFKVKIEEVVFTPPTTPATPPGVPLPYPLEDGPDAGALGRLKGQEPKFEGAFGRAPDDDDGDSLEAIARKAGKGQQEFLTVKMEDILVTSRDAPLQGVDGESMDAKHKAEIEVLAARAGVGDSHKSPTRYIGETEKNLGADAPDDDGPDDDDPEPSTLARLRPEASAKEMLPGLGGHVLDDLELDADADADDDGDDDDSDESEL